MIRELMEGKKGKVGGISININPMPKQPKYFINSRRKSRGIVASPDFFTIYKGKRMKNKI